MKSIKCHVTMKYDTYKNWMECNPLLLKGEIAIVEIDKDIIKLKVGDGREAFL